MKKQYIKSFTALLLAIFLMNSCDLTREPYDAIPRQNSLQSISDATKWATGFMSSFRNCIGGRYTTLQEYQADYLNASLGFGNRGGGWYNWSTLDAKDYDVKDVWHAYYAALKNINEFLSLSEKLELTKDEDKKLMQTYLGDAHLLRAYYYYELAVRYGTRYDAASAGSDLCVPLVLMYDLAELPQRATNEAVYKQIADDIAEAKTMLKERKNEPMSQVFTEDAAFALEARVALAKKDWNTALNAADKIISSKRYPLVSPVQKSFEDMWRADDSTEDLVLLYVKKTDEEPNTISFYGYSATLKANSPDWYPTQGIIDLYTDEDLRKEVYFEKSRVKVEDYVMNDIYVVSKYKGNPIYNTTADPRYIIRPKVFRMGEIYMIAAEAAYMSNSTGDKAPDKYLNAFRASRGLAPVASTDAALLKDIKEERTRELAFEGHRLWDLRRWGDQMKRMSPQKSADLSPNGIEIGSDFLTTMVPFDFLVNPDNHRWIWPIPYNELTTNVNIKNQQNPGW